MEKRPIPSDIDLQIMGIAHQLAAGGEGENYPAAVMIVPTVLKLKEFLNRYGLDEFMRLIDHYYRTFDSILLKEIVVILSPDRHPGKFYHLFARKVAEVLTKEAGE